jgi:DNA modification methylase
MSNKMPNTRTHTSKPPRVRRAGTARRWRVQHADCLTALPKIDAASVDAVITDPPYGINFEGMAWDDAQIRKAAENDLRVRGRLGTPGRNRGGSAFGSPSAYAGSYDLTPRGMGAFEAFTAAWGAECLRILKPGGHIAIFGYPRTFHRLTAGIEAAGFEIRDVLLWLHGQGFPKSHNLTGQGAGWGTALKPAYEPILLARRPFDGSTEQNHARYGTGAINIDACRLPAEQQQQPACRQGRARTPKAAGEQGRWPANLLLSHNPDCDGSRCRLGCPAGMLGQHARFFYTAKTSRAERDAGCKQLPHATIQTFKIGVKPRLDSARRPVANIHPTVKPLALMRWLTRLITPQEGLVLDPFTGSGSTGAAAVLEGARFHGIEREDAYVPIARARIQHWANNSSRSANRRRGDCR